MPAVPTADVQDAELANLLARMRGREEEAVAVFVREYEHVIQREAVFCLERVKLRRVVNENDISQSVLIRFYENLTEGRYVIQCQDDLVGLLKAMVRGHVSDLTKYWYAECRDMHRNFPMFQAPEITGSSDPSRRTMAKELLDKTYGHLPRQQREIFELRRGGASWAEIADLISAASPEAVRKKHHRALARVSEEVDPEAS